MAAVHNRFGIDNIKQMSKVIRIAFRFLMEVAMLRDRSVHTDGIAKFIHIVAILRVYDATDPRDKIYGELGLASEAVRSSTRPDCSLPLAHAYTNTAFALMKESKSLTLFKDATPAKRRLDNSPSSLPWWVPYWTTENCSQSTLLDQQAKRNYFRVGASSGLSAELINNPCPQTRCLALDSVRTV